MKGEWKTPANGKTTEENEQVQEAITVNDKSGGNEISVDKKNYMLAWCQRLKTSTNTWPHSMCACGLMGVMSKMDLTIDPNHNFERVS